MVKNEPVALRPGAVADLEAIVAVHLEAALAGFSGIFPATTPAPTAESIRPRWSELISNPHVDVFVAEATDVVGCSVLRPESDVPPACCSTASTFILVGGATESGAASTTPRSLPPATAESTG